MIIVEGPDGAGKTTLIEKLKERYNLPVHERFCTSEGPVDNLFHTIFEDLLTWDKQPLSIFDRHSLMSEYVYSLCIPDRVIDKQFLGSVAATMLRRLAYQSLVILCMPPFEHITANIHQNKQMEGVTDNLYAIYQTYGLLNTFWPVQTRIINYDYTDSQSERNVFSRCNLHIAEWRNNGNSVV